MALHLSTTQRLPVDESGSLACGLSGDRSVVVVSTTAAGADNSSPPFTTAAVAIGLCCSTSSVLRSLAGEELEELEGQFMEAEEVEGEGDPTPLTPPPPPLRTTANRMQRKWKIIRISRLSVILETK